MSSGIHYRITKKPSNSFDQESLEHPSEHPASPAYPAITPPSSPCLPGPSIQIDDHFEGSLAEMQARYGTFTEGGLCTGIFYTTACTEY